MWSPWRQWTCDSRFSVLGNVTLETGRVTPGAAKGEGVTVDTLDVLPQGHGLAAVVILETGCLTTDLITGRNLGPVWSSLGTESAPLYILTQFFPYILLLVATLLCLPSLFWRFTAAPHVCSDLKFIVEELDKIYNRAIKAAKSMHDLDLRDGACPAPEVNENMGQREDVAEDESQNVLRPVPLLDT
ncbi:hypothetical protein E5288_WYG002793 [Bos mutus]|uniref:Uncharacterized protein n=1 Tax=Bos mutus TaxID=72004 RepID=A0A6B0SA10_9CETA|nr:hypothetical protein [Bos mutus]